MGKKFRSGQRRKQKNIRRKKRKAQKSFKKKIKSVAKETVSKVERPPEGLLNKIDTIASNVTPKAFIKEINEILKRDEMDLKDEDYELYLAKRNDLLNILISNKLNILKNISLHLGVNKSVVLEPLSAELIFKNFLKLEKRSFIDKMINKAFKYNIILEEGDSIYNRPISFEVKYWFKCKDKSCLTINFKYVSDKKFNYKILQSIDTDLKDKIISFLKL